MMVPNAKSTLTTTGNTPFRFLDLPKELRLMVYERLPTETRHHGFVNMEDSWTYAEMRRVEGAMLELVHKTLSGLRILRTCRQVNHEARDILARRLAKMRGEHVRIITNLKTLRTLRLGLLLENILRLDNKHDAPDLRDLASASYQWIFNLPDRRVKIAFQNRIDIAIVDAKDERYEDLKCWGEILGEYIDFHDILSRIKFEDGSIQLPSIRLRPVQTDSWDDADLYNWNRMIGFLQIESTPAVKSWQWPGIEPCMADVIGIEEWEKNWMEGYRFE